jgi:hypothetical protein
MHEPSSVKFQVSDLTYHRNVKFQVSDLTYHRHDHTGPEPGIHKDRKHLSSETGHSCIYDFFSTLNIDIFLCLIRIQNHTAVISRTPPRFRLVCGMFWSAIAICVITVWVYRPKMRVRFLVTQPYGRPTFCSCMLMSPSLKS